MQQKYKGTKSSRVSFCVPDGKETEAKELLNKHFENQETEVYKEWKNSKLNKKKKV